MKVKDVIKELSTYDGDASVMRKWAGVMIKRTTAQTAARKSTGLGGLNE